MEKALGREHESLTQLPERFVAVDQVGGDLSAFAPKLVRRFRALTEAKLKSSCAVANGSTEGINRSISMKL